jgi:hypothetical protein
MDCPGCGSVQSDGGNFCRKCGTALIAKPQVHDDTAGLSGVEGAAEPQVIKAGRGRAPANGSLSPAGGEPKWSRRGVLVAGLVVVVVLAGLVGAGRLERWPAAVFGQTGPATGTESGSGVLVPADAARVVTNLMSRDTATVRESLATSYSAQVSPASLAPPGTMIRVQRGSWEQRGGNARLRAVVTMRGRAPVTEIVYLVREGGRWRVLFTGAP